MRCGACIKKDCCPEKRLPAENHTHLIPAAVKETERISDPEIARSFYRCPRIDLFFIHEDIQFDTSLLRGIAYCHIPYHTRIFCRLVRESGKNGEQKQKTEAEFHFRLLSGA